MTQAKPSKKSRRAERREQARRREPSSEERPPASDDSEVGKGQETASGSDPVEKRGSTEAIRDRNLRLREEAAARRRAKRERARASSNVRNLDAGEMVDDALARGTHVATQWLRKHFNKVQWVIVALVVVGVGWQIYSWRSKKTRAKASDVLIDGVRAQQGIVGTLTGPEDPDVVPEFPDDKARLTQAAKEYEEALKSLAAGSGPHTLAELGLAGVLFEEKKFDKALKHYRTVAKSALSKSDPDVRWRSLEGIGLSLEGKKDVDGALREFGRLANAERVELSALGLYHQARLQLGKGEKAKAKELLEKARKKLEKLPKPDSKMSFLGNSIREVMTTIDPAAARGATAEIESLREQLATNPNKIQELLDDIKRGMVPEQGPLEPDGDEEEEAETEGEESDQEPSDEQDSKPSQVPAPKPPTSQDKSSGESPK